jgi:hypothetical protein
MNKIMATASVPLALLIVQGMFQLVTAVSN